MNISIKLQSRTISIGITSSITNTSMTIIGIAKESFPKKVRLYRTMAKHCCSKAPDIPRKYRHTHQIKVAIVSLRILSWYALLLIGLPEYIIEVTNIMTNTLVANIKLRTVHSIEKAWAESTEARYSMIIISYKVPSTVIVTVKSYFPRPWQIIRNKSACPRFNKASCYQKSNRNAVITMNSGIIMNKNSFLGNSSISSELVDAVIAALSAAISCSSAIPLLYIRQAMMNPEALITPVMKRQM